MKHTIIFLLELIHKQFLLLHQIVNSHDFPPSVSSIDCFQLFLHEKLNPQCQCVREGAISKDLEGIN